MIDETSNSPSPASKSALTPVFTGLRISTYLLLVGLVAFAAVRSVLVGIETGQWAKPIAVTTLAGVFLLTFLLGALGWIRRNKALRITWLLAMTVEWALLGLFTTDAAFIVFPLFFLFLHLLPRYWGIGMVSLATLFVILILARESGWGVGGIIGPIIGAIVAIVIARGYELLFAEAREREALIADLVTTRQALGESERAAGALAERERLARDIHDTVAQGLSSIQLLLHTAERADAAHPAVEQIRLARQTAASSLAETRKVIQALTPVDLEKHSLHGALVRLGETTTLNSGVPVTVETTGKARRLPMSVQTALLRVAQGALANAVQHALAKSVSLRLEFESESVSLEVADDGRGFEPAEEHSPDRARPAFGLRAIRERAHQLGGTATVTSRIGEGTSVRVEIPIEPAERSQK